MDTGALVRVSAALAACLLLVFVLADVFFTVVLARRSQWSFRITRAFYTITWTPFAKLAMRIGSGRRREDYLSIYGPISLLSLLVCWMIGMIVAFGVLHWSAGLKGADGGSGMLYDLYFSGAGLFTAIATEPQNQMSRFLLVAEAGLGISMLGLVVGYLPVLYQSFSSRELRILKLDARAGSPPSAAHLLARRGGDPDKLFSEMESWEEWSAEFYQAHVSYPMLAYFRSLHSDQSWLTALVSMLDASAIVMITSQGDLHWQARLVHCMGVDSLKSLTRIFRLDPMESENRLTPDEFAQLQGLLAGRPGGLDTSRLSSHELNKLSAAYEPHANALSHYFLMALPRWVPQSAEPDRQEVSDQAVSDPFHENAGSS